MIEEDYVNFEIAKLLKERGFDVYGDGSFGSETKVWMEYSPTGKINDVSTSRPHPKAYPAPTLQMTMKWLREVHNINIEIFYFCDGNPARWAFEIIRLPIGATVFGEYSEKSFEEACETAIKYCLENWVEIENT